MKTLEELLTQWEDSRLTAEDAAALKRLLANPEARAELVGDWLLHEAVHGTLSSECVEQAAAGAPATDRVAAPSPGQDRRPVLQANAGNRPAAREAAPHLQPGLLRSFMPRLVWREVHLSLRWPLGVAVAAGLLLLGVYLYFENAPVANLAGLRGVVTVERRGRELSCSNGQSLRPNDLVRVPAGGAATLKWPKEPTQIELGASTAVRVLGQMRGKKLSLQTGQLLAVVARQWRWRPMSVQTPQAEVTVVGTRFLAEASPTVTRVEVTEGAVVVRKTRPTSVPDKGQITLRAGEYALASPTVAMQALPAAGRAFREVLAYPVGTPRFGNAVGTVVWSDTISNLSVSAGPATVTRSPDNRYECRIRCLITPPATDNYSFAVQSRLPCELYLSSDETPAERKRIFFTRLPVAGSPTNTLSGLVLIGPSPSFGQFPLVAGQRYYLEVLQEYDPSEFVMLAWAVWGKAQGGRGPALEPITGPVLAPFPETAPAAGGARHP
jgi:hypothetical protein